MAGVESSSQLIEATIVAYRQGAFPMAQDGQLGFFQCDPRSIYFFDQFHRPKRLQRMMKQGKFQYKMDQAFEEVIQGCRRDRPEWISEELVSIYTRLFEMGIAHSFEAWEGDQLAGGVYGMSFGAAFMAESMFHNITHGSNLALMYMIDCLSVSGYHFCDIQYSNEHTERFNPIQVPKLHFQNMLKEAMSVDVELKSK
jgi:leucyl/phenylalanyl-tRNA--protein transferase